MIELILILGLPILCSFVLRTKPRLRWSGYVLTGIVIGCIVPYFVAQQISQEMVASRGFVCGMPIMGAYMAHLFLFTPFSLGVLFLCNRWVFTAKTTTAR